MSMFLIPAYTPPRKTANTTTRFVKTCADNASKQLNQLGKHQQLEVYTDAVLCYIKNGIDIVTKHIRVYPNQKPWMTMEVQQLLKERNIAFRSLDRALYSIAWANLKKGIRQAKADYGRKINDHLATKKQAGMALSQTSTNFRPSRGPANGDASLTEKLNLFLEPFWGGMTGHLGCTKQTATPILLFQWKNGSWGAKGHQPKEGCRTRGHLRTCAKGLCRPVGGDLHHYL